MIRILGWDGKEENDKERDANAKETEPVGKR